MTGAKAQRRRTLLFKAALLALAVTSLLACGEDAPPVTSEAPLAPAEPNAPPLDTTPAIPDTIVPPLGGGDSTAPPVPPNPDPITPPPDPMVPGAPAPDPTVPGPPPEHVGMPFGPYHLPPSDYGSEFTGGLRVTHPIYLMADLEAARRAGARVVLSMVGAERRIRGPDGHFSLAKWKLRLDRYRDFDFSSYIEDGTIIGHYIMDEPHDPTNWSGKTVSRSDVDEMAKYSKQLWPSMVTIIRGWPDYLKGYEYKYLDAAWAQYSERFGDIDTFIANNVRDAKASGLGLVVGLNLLGGGGPNGIKGFYVGRPAMTASQLRSWGSALLAEPYACAFISWKYNETYFSRSDIRSAFAELREKARSRAKKSCSN